MHVLPLGSTVEESEPSQHPSLHWYSCERGQEPSAHYRVCWWRNTKEDNQKCGKLLCLGIKDLWDWRPSPCFDWTNDLYLRYFHNHSIPYIHHSIIILFIQQKPFPWAVRVSIARDLSSGMVSCHNFVKYTLTRVILCTILVCILISELPSQSGDSAPGLHIQELLTSKGLT